MSTHRSLTAAALAALVLTGVSALGVAAQGTPTGPPLARYRAAVMTSLQEHQGALRLLLSGEVAHPEHVALHARALREALDMAAATFPEGSGGPGTRALPAIWEHWDDFAAKLQSAQEAAAVLHATADAGDIPGAVSALREVSQSCLACHGDYRARAPIGAGGS